MWNWYSRNCIWKDCLQNGSHFVVLINISIIFYLMPRADWQPIQADIPPWLTHWGRVTHICIRKLSTIGSANGLSLGQRQAIIWTNAGMLLIHTIGTNCSEMLCEIHTFHSRKCIQKCHLGYVRDREKIAAISQTTFFNAFLMLIITHHTLVIY